MIDSWWYGVNKTLAFWRLMVDNNKQCWCA